MADTLEERLLEAVLNDDFSLALDLFAQAISIHPTKASLFADRAQLNFKLQRYTDTVADANKAIELDPSLTKAYLRKGLACMQLKEFKTAKAALEKGASMDPSNQKFLESIKVCDKEILEERNNHRKEEVSDRNVRSEPPLLDFTSADVDPQKEKGSSMLGNLDLIPEMARVQPKYRHEFYQKSDEIVLTVFAKRIPVESVSVEFGEQMLSVHITLPGEEDFIFQPRLFAKIVPQKCRFQVLPTKIEIRLCKANPINWTSLEYKGFTTHLKMNVSPSSEIKSQRPAYPSSKSRGIDWDHLESQVKKEEKDEKLEGDAALNKLFRDIYSSSDEDTRRAMNKSFVESNGTVLSTNWKEVGTKPVEGSAPDGMEMKKWEY